MKNRLIIITGDLASGKSTLADALGKHLNVPVFKKDVIKEQYCDLPINQAFAKADDLLAEVAKSLVHSMMEPQQAIKKTSRIKAFFKRLKCK